MCGLKKIFSGFVLSFLLMVSQFSNQDLYSQNRTADSLMSIIHGSAPSERKISAYVSLARYYIIQDSDNAIKYAYKAADLSKKIKNDTLLSGAYNVLGQVYHRNGDYGKALGTFGLELSVLEKLKDSLHIGNSYNNLAVVSHEMGDNLSALTHNLNALSVRESIGDNRGVASTYHNIGLIYDEQGKKKLALENYFKALEIKETISIDAALETYMNIGTVYNELDSVDLALKYLEKAKNVSERIRDTFMLAVSEINIGDVYLNKEDYYRASDHYSLALRISEKNNNNFLKAHALSSLGNLHFKQKKYSSAILFFRKSVDLFEGMGMRVKSMEDYKMLAANYFEKEDYFRAYQNLAKFINIKDTIQDQNNQKLIAEMQEKYNTTQKEQQIKMMEVEAQVKDLEIDKHKTQSRYSLIVGIVLFVIVILLIVLAIQFYNNIQARKKNNSILQEKNDIIEHQKDDLILERNRMLESIRYAKRIQNSFLIPESHLKDYFSDSFILYEARDIVSGDFYWFSKVEGKYIVAAVDCTGHGVPGAFMSMLGNRLLNEIVNVMGITTPNLIIEKLHKSIVKDLRQDESDQSQDGMDMFIYSIDPKNGELEYSGAKSKAILIEDNNLEVLKTTAEPVGGKRTNEKSIERKYKLFKRTLKKNSILYSFSDGYSDQFGGPEKLKYGSKKFRNLLYQIHTLPFDKQKKMLYENIGKWKGDLNQVDDMLVLGIKIY